MAASRTLTAEQRQERARRAGQAAQSTDALISRLERVMDQLTPAQETRLTRLVLGDGDRVPVTAPPASPEVDDDSFFD